MPATRKRRSLSPTRRAFRCPTPERRIKGAFLFSLYTFVVFFVGLQMNIGFWTSSFPTVSYVRRNPLCVGANQDTNGGNHHSFESQKDEANLKSQLCAFPELDPFDPKIVGLIKKYPTLNCYGNSPSIVDAVDNELRVNLTKVKAKLKSGSIDSCRYRALFSVVGKQMVIAFSGWSDNFTQSIRVKDDEEFFHVQCFYNNEMVSVSYTFLIRKKIEVEVERLSDYVKHLKRREPKESLNVLIVGIDGMSRENVIRTMPKTRKFLLERLRAVDFKKYNKVGMNTYPNIVPFLTGSSEHEFPSYWNESMPFDTIDHLFLWKRYQNAGYRTAVMFDNTFDNMFHYLKKGWDKPSFDYFPRPLVMEAELGDNEGYRKTDENCMGDVPQVSHLLDYWVQLAKLFDSPQTPYFAYSFFTKLSHDNQDKASAGDELYLEFFREMHTRNLLNNTVLVFFSDHGLRFGALRDTYNGVIESKHPFAFFTFPPWFEGKYPKLMATFRNNSNSLMTTFDMHATLVDLLHFTGEAKRQSSSPPARATSLFSPIPANRTCKDAGILLEYCVCSLTSARNLASSNVSEVLVENLMRKIVNATSEHRDKCVVLRHKETKTVMLLTPEVPFLTSYEFLYYVKIQTTPGDAVYEATLLYDSKHNDVIIQDEIVRINLYRGQADCVYDVDLRYFCYCRDNISKN